MSPFSLRSLLLAAVVLSNCITWTASRHHYKHNVSGHRSRHRRQGAGLFLSASHVLPGGEGTGWGEWGEVSPCSRTCGGGVASQKRICLQIGPDGQPQCSGGDTKYFSCQTQDCPAGSKDFRAQQCSEFDDVAFRDIKYKWVPYTQAPNQCELNCMPHGERFYYRHRRKVVDGTRCNDESFDVCVNGTCQPVGCDMMLGSSAREDKCRECRGNGANCETNAGVLDTQDLRKGYNDILLIPEGATTIVIAERAPSNNYLALRAKNGTYYLNGEYHIDFPRSLVIAGALWYYERSQQGFAAPDKLRCLGPINEPLYLALLLQDENVGIDYEYSVPSEKAPPRNKQYNWVHEEFTPCSEACGGGFQTRNVTCRSREELELVDEGLCDKEMKPPTNQTCNTEPCDPEWTLGPWGNCSKRCGEGGTRSREVQCTQIITNGYPSIVADKKCFDLHGPKPELFETCNENATCPIWFTGPWKPCDKLCDEGKQTRKVVCYQKIDGRIEVLGDEECEEEKPAEAQTCMLQLCDGVDWVLSEWTGCDSCLSTVRTRFAVCSTKAGAMVNESFCSYHEKPETQQPCDKTLLPPCELQWYATQWSKCSVDCGKGFQSRKVFCGLFDGSSVMKVADQRCAGQPKYNDTKECEIPKEKCPSQWFAAPWSACTKKCGGGEKFRHVMCLRGGEPATDCDGSLVLDDVQSCNPGPCDADELLPVAGESTVEDEVEECVEEEETYPEVGVEAEMLDKDEHMLSDTTIEGSGMWTSTTVEHESEFEPDSTLTSEELLKATPRGDSSDTDSLDEGEDSTETTIIDTSGTDLTDTEINETATTEVTEPVSTEATEIADTNNTATTESESINATETTEITESTETPETGSTNANETTVTINSTATAVSGSTETTETDNSTAITVTGSTEASETTETDNSTATTESGSTETTETDNSTETTVSGSTDTTETDNSTATTVSGSTETTETDNSTATAVSGNTETTETDNSTATVVSGSTETTETDNSTATVVSGSTETTETDNSTETTVSGSTETTESDNSTATTVSGSTNASETTETDNSTAITESGSTETTETDNSTTTTVSGSTETTETDNSTATTESGSTETTETDSSTETTVSGSTETTETDNSTVTTVSGSTETTETDNSTATTVSESTNATETTESDNSTATTVFGSTETTETDNSTATTVSGSTETTETDNSTATTVSESTNATETTESDNSTATTVSGNTETTETDNSTATTVSGSTETTEIDNSTATTESGSTNTTETTETDNSTATTVSGSTDATETTETDNSTETTVFGSTNTTETTETDNSTETTVFGSSDTTETTESGSTDSMNDTETTEIGSSTETIETTTETMSNESTVSPTGTESSPEPTTEASSESTTRWDLSSTVEYYTTKKARVCRLRKCGSEFGCCPDKKTPALGPFDEGCPKPVTCKEAFHGCCPDGLSPAQGPDNEGCPVEPCAETLFGCCESDNKTAAEGNDQEGCPPPPPACFSSKYGCCKDGETEATGPEKEGCPETSTTAVTDNDTVTPTDTEETETSTISSSTEAIEGCAASEFGCCFDNETAATGPELQGCPCNTTEFGCCPDDIAPAQGPDFEGCEKSCNTSAYGCCPDEKTPAHGPDGEGCCLLSSFGCCPDNHKPADGPHLEGCGCQYSRFGCCPDKVTVASGPDNKGCGCLYTEHGCCPDRHSEASGPDFEGCKCHTYQFGCCPDGVTIAVGPNGQGCYCQQSTYGCCSDEQTHAKGPNKEGCDCATSKYGCCLDGTTEATGPKFEGCTEKPENKQAACSLKFERGPCRNYSVNWFYDTEYGGCSRFWYGGCEGNGNRFGSKEECEDTCVNPPPKDACKLPQIKGACGGYNVRWYYDSSRESCTNFVYGGCLGNNNNFETRELCQAQCEPEQALDQCSLEIERGTCSGNYPRWGFNKQMRRCEEFIWGGCEGNSNRFSTEAACLLRCNPPGEPKPECSEPQDVGNCTDTEALWSFSQSENRCVPFYYTGCGGNDNKFTTQEDCQASCPSSFVPELCTLPASTGDCADYREKWYYDTKDQRCRQFYYGGCGGNGNKFDSEQECERRCTVPATTTVAPSAATAVQPQPDADRSDFCFLAIDSGPCNQLETKWAYDYAKGKCTAFQYGGCGGNQNNFPTEEHCTYYCKPTQDICQLPMLAGPCDASVMQWFYDASSDSCSQFTYGGCEGNDNRFANREDCERRCKTGPAPTSPSPITTTTVKVEDRVGESLPSECVISPELEQCSGSTPGEVWYYNVELNECKPHRNLETGADCRATGIFYSKEACERSCGAFRNIDVCKYPMEPGPCLAYLPKYHYNATSRRCEEFVYGGCLGGPNQFSTAQECEQICMSAFDPCTLPVDPGNCVDRIEKWYYDQPRDQCYQFAYGGCGGNENNFESREVCERSCRRQPAITTPVPLQTTTQPEPLEQCRTPLSLEPCGTNVTAYYYDEGISQCKVADIGACSYSNRYRSEEECERHCGSFRGLEVCRAPLDPGPCRASIPKFYFDTASGSCLSYAYGGCNGGPNRFSTSEECEEVCAGAGPAAACLRPVATGERCGAVPERRWHYDAARADCLVFAYQGCAGNQNNFRSYEECAYLCRIATPDDNESRVCDRYAEECITLELSCEYDLRKEVAPEGCERCVCQAPVNCELQQRECDALKCSYGIQRTRTQEGCERCKCLEDPCSTSNCASSERCVASAYRDPVTQDVLFSAHCVPEHETNEVVPACDAYIEECEHMSCPSGTALRRVSDGACVRCVCEPQDCSPQRALCDTLQCPYGLVRGQLDGCESCECVADPCSGHECAAGERCVAEPFRDAVTQEVQYAPDCRIVNKPGSCPRSTESAAVAAGPCRRECADDADCRGVLKCCSVSCSQICLAPAVPDATTHTPDVPQAPQASVETEPQVAATEGGKATLRCIFHGNPPPRITWRFGEITIDSDVDRYRILSDGALEIISLFRNDSGVYICVAENDLGSAQQQITLNVNDPARAAAEIAGAADASVTGELGRAAVVRCRAYGYPPPSIFWYRGDNGGMVPYSSAQFEARGQELTIRRLTLDTLGDYECTAYNGEGRPATWRVTVQAYQPRGEFIPGNRYLVQRPARAGEATPRAPDLPPATTRAPDVEIPSYAVPVHTELLPASTSITVGAQLSLPCEVDGYPEPDVHWTKDNELIASSERIWITGSRLIIPAAEVNDSGVYSCHAANAYSSHSSTVRISVQEVYIPAKCVDNPTFANCALIVQSKFCRHKYYSRFCCKSCVEAGQLDPRDVEMQADEPFRKK